jgi:2-polyprenyl-3-methyl-5-hydroxy-6-metoxy-1,4-benzoquinol methylase
MLAVLRFSERCHPRMATSYAVRVTETADALRRYRLYEKYASHHSGCSNGAAASLVYRRDIRPMLPSPSVGPVLDIGCGQGDLVRMLLADGYDAAGVDVSPEQVALAAAAGVETVRLGDFRAYLAERPRQFGAVTATDVLEHLTKTEVLSAFDEIAAALAIGGVFVARVPNGVSPFGGHIQYGDFTHESWFTAGSVRQLAAAAGFSRVCVMPSPPVAHGLASAIRLVTWKAVSGLCKVALAAETGVLSGHIVTQNLTFAARRER